MRLSEKTIELNFCTQAARYLHDPLWFGLTQKQEAQFGFDAGTRDGLDLLLFQFKASNEFVEGERKFKIPHDQLCNLQRLAKGPRSVYYALPMIGESSEVIGNHDILGRTWLVDVADIPAVPAPLKRDGCPRKSRNHYLRVGPNSAGLYSDRVELNLIQARALFENGPRKGDPSNFGDSLSEYEVTHGLFSGSAIGLVVNENRWGAI